MSELVRSHSVEEPVLPCSLLLFQAGSAFFPPTMVKSAVVPFSKDMFGFVVDLKEDVDTYRHHAVDIEDEGSLPKIYPHVLSRLLHSYGWIQLWSVLNLAERSA